MKFNNSLWTNICRLIGVNHIHLKNVQIPIIIDSMNKAIFNSNNGCKWWWNFKSIGNKDFLSYSLIMATSCSWPIKEKINLKLLNSKSNMKVNRLWIFLSSYIFKKEKKKSIAQMIFLMFFAKVSNSIIKSKSSLMHPKLLEKLKCKVKTSKERVGARSLICSTSKVRRAC